MTSGQLKLGIFGGDNFGLGFAITSDISAGSIQGTRVLLNGVATL